MSNGWIPTTERLPDQREFIESYVRSAYAAEFLVTIDGADKATTLYYSQTGVWFDEQGEPYKVVAWMLLPERYKDTVIRQQAKPSRMQAGFHTM